MVDDLAQILAVGGAVEAWCLQLYAAKSSVVEHHHTHSSLLGGKNQALNVLRLRLAGETR